MNQSTDQVREIRPICLTHEYYLWVKNRSDVGCSMDCPGELKESWWEAVDVDGGLTRRARALRTEVRR